MTDAISHSHYKPRFRLRFTFWLDLFKSDERELADHIEELKEKRQFAPSIREGLRLLWSLREKRVDVLEKLFPWIADHYHAQYAESIANTEFARLIAGFQQQGMSIPLSVPEHVSIFCEETEAVDGAEARENFAKGMGDLFGGDDDLWD